MGLIWYGIVSARSVIKHIKNHLFFKVFGGPRPSKRASGDPKGPPRCYLGLLEAILGPSWEKELLRELRQDRPLRGIAILYNFGIHFGAQNLLILYICWRHFLNYCLTIFWITFGAHFRTRSAQEGAKMKPRNHQELQRPKKNYFQKP